MSNTQTPTKRKKILAVSSKGGHWVQLMRITPALESRYDLIFASTNEKYADAVGAERFTPLKDYTRRNAYRMLSVIATAYKLMRRERPDVILTTGSAPAIGVILAGKLLGIKSIWINSIANAEHMSLSGRIARYVANRCYSQWEHLSGPRVHYAGNIFG